LILLLEIGNSYWTVSNYITFKNAKDEFYNRGQVLFYNYEKFIDRDPEIRIVQKKRKLHGKLYFYVLEKL